MSAKLIAQHHETKTAPPAYASANEGSPVGLVGIRNGAGERTMRRMQSRTLTERVIGFLECYGESLYA